MNQIRGREQSRLPACDGARICLLPLKAYYKTDVGRTSREFTRVGDFMLRREGGRECEDGGREGRVSLRSNRRDDSRGKGQVIRLLSWRKRGDRHRERGGTARDWQGDPIEGQGGRREAEGTKEDGPVGKNNFNPNKIPPDGQKRGIEICFRKERAGAPHRRELLHTCLLRWGKEAAVGLRGVGKGGDANQADLASRKYLAPKENLMMRGD